MDFRDHISEDNYVEEKSHAGCLYLNGGIMGVFSIFSTFLVNLFGKEHIDMAIPTIGFTALLVFFSAVAYNGIHYLGLFSLDSESEKSLFLFVGIFCLVSFGISCFLGLISESYEYSHCGMCKRDLACEKIGETLVEGVVENGVIKQVTTKKYKCRFCGHIIYKIDKSDKFPDVI